MSGNGFDSIAQAMLAQKQKMDELQAENNELRRQIADLRAGHGVFIEIAGIRFPLKGEITSPAIFEPTSVQQEEFPSSPTTFALPEVQESYAAMQSVTPTQELSPLPNTLEAQEEPEKASTFLEEIMIDEFATASTSPIAVWQEPSKKPQREQIDEEQKAALRRELMGSFLLE